MRHDAENHEDEDKRKKELIEARNEADSLVYNAEKSLKDLGDKVAESEKAVVEGKINLLREAIKSEDVSNINSARDELMTVMHPIAEKLYAANNASGSAGPETPDASPQSDGGTTVDADFSASDENK
jgi:molecular chaperone DnaK